MTCHGFPMNLLGLSQHIMMIGSNLSTTPNLRQSRHHLQLHWAFPVPLDIVLEDSALEGVLLIT